MSANIPFTEENLMCANVTFTWGNCVRKCKRLLGKIVCANEPHSFKNVRKCAATFKEHWKVLFDKTDSLRCYESALRLGLRGGGVTSDHCD